MRKFGLHQWKSKTGEYETESSVTVKADESEATQQIPEAIKYKFESVSSLPSIRSLVTFELQPFDGQSKRRLVKLGEFLRPKKCGHTLLDNGASLYLLDATERGLTCATSQI